MALINLWKILTELVIAIAFFEKFGSCNFISFFPIIMH